jgi:hypothetical protein
MYIKEITKENTLQEANAWLGTNFHTVTPHKVKISELIQLHA